MTQIRLARLAIMGAVMPALLAVNDVCSTVYWYQAGPVRPFVKIPDFSKLLPGVELHLVLTNTGGTNHGAWALAFRAVAADGAAILPQSE